ncbi:CLUMA_CG014151, isoform A [Clunio marinus]|uniref:CLUMA_CG014151, isoform A n=1 Tax=Clunio marinus TaxID=568069 RepID=A0A1J1IKY5_9DIPT|nr:CLUMA_CG014151, isoform A [Clunio marinus]
MESSEDEVDNAEDEPMLCKYGTQLTPYEADEIPSKKPIQIEDQFVKDENGRRRFHGAFTGGFSAGYWNTVGSKDGFTPSEFKSSRSEKQTVKTFQPTDFMDEEDLGEFGIAHQKIQTTEDFSSGSSKRKYEKPSEGPIPGEPVLKNLLKPIRDKAAVRILKSMGWRDHQGIGSRLTYREKKRTNERNQREMYIQTKYGCDIGLIKQKQDSEDEDDLSDDEITFAPDDFDPYIANVKNNAFGLGYSGLKPSSILSSKSQHVNLFQTFQVVDRNNKKLSIRGQAFGVGALEEEDDDIYAMDDMSRYDRSLDEGEKTKRKLKAIKPVDSSIIEGFTKATISETTVKVFTVDLPRSFEPRNWLTRQSRFEPIDVNRAKALEEKNKHKVLGLGRHDFKPEERGALLNEKVEKNSEKINSIKESSTAKIQESAIRITELLNSKQFVSEKNESFKPFIGNPEKQERYDKFLTLKSSSSEKEVEKFLNDIQPLSMSNFDREMERKEFMQAKRMYQPLDSLMGNRFIKETDLIREENSHKKTENGKKIIVIHRTKVMWKPHKDLCKRFNVPEPFGGMMFDEDEEKNRKKQTSSLFDYIGVPLNTKANFVTPQVVPRKLAVDDRKKNAEDEQRKNFLAAVEKEKSFMAADTSKRAAAKDFFESNDVPTVKKPPTELRKEARKEPAGPPKTELEIKVAESVHKKPQDKKDLFKAIFCDSDDDDEGDQDDNEKTIEKGLSEAQKSSFIESFLNTKSASEINVLRNDEAPRGIFKSILTMSSSMDVNKSEEKEKPVEDLYGPKLPDKDLPQTSASHERLSQASSSSESDLDEKLLKKLKKLKKKKKNEEEWVEKDKLNEKKSKKYKKKHKKHKSKNSK